MDNVIMKTYNTTNIVSDKYLKINSCGFQNNHMRKFKIQRAEGRVDYHILYVLKGEIEVEYEKRDMVMSKGEMVLYPPNVTQKYTFSDKYETISFWVHFTGNAVDEILNDIGLYGGIYKTKYIYNINNIMNNLVDKFNTCYSFENIGANAQLLLLLEQIALNCFEVEKENVISHAVKYMNCNYTREIDITECACLCNLSVSRFSHLFKEIMKVSPYQYIMNLRLGKAYEYLMYTDMNIMEVSEVTGFKDSLYFSKMFKRKYSFSPSKLKH